MKSVIKLLILFVMPICILSTCKKTTTDIPKTATTPTTYAVQAVTN